MSEVSFKLEIPPDEPLIIWSRFVKASPELVFDAWTRPEHLRNWWGPRWHDLIVCEVDLRIGGGYRFVQRSSNGIEHGFRGTYLEIDRPRWLVSTFVYDGSPGHQSIDSFRFDAVGDGTTISCRSRHDSIESRDMHVEAGMEAGLTDSLSRLEKWAVETKEPLSWLTS